MKNRIRRLAVLLVLFTSTAAFANDLAPRRVENFNRDWKFAKRALPGAEALDYNDAAWLPVRLPHDWAISGPYEPQGDPHTGKLPARGEGWHRESHPSGQWCATECRDALCGQTPALGH